MKNILRNSAIALGLVALGSSGVLAEGGPRGGHARPSFTELDSNSDGVITLAEVQGLAQTKFNATDTNGDGQLDAAELTAAAARQREGIIARMIAHKDTNGDGLLSLEEMAPQQRGPSRLFTRADTDGNGEISQAEWDAAQAHRRDQPPRGPQNPPAGN